MREIIDKWENKNVGIELLNRPFFCRKKSSSCPTKSEDSRKIQENSVRKQIPFLPHQITPDFCKSLLQPPAGFVRPRRSRPMMSATDAVAGFALKAYCLKKFTSSITSPSLTKTDVRFSMSMEHKYFVFIPLIPSILSINTASLDKKIDL